MFHAKRLTALFTGHVQGVGFRMTAVHVARGFAVTGYVRNLPDGRVRLVAEGAQPDLEAFLGAIENRMARRLRNTEHNFSPATGTFTGFALRH